MQVTLIFFDTTL